MQWRKINLRMLIEQGLLYRTIVIVVNGLFNTFAIKLIMAGYVGEGFAASLVWNLCVNMPLYYAYHYPWHSLVKLGKK